MWQHRISLWRAPLHPNIDFAAVQMTHTQNSEVIPFLYFLPCCSCSTYVWTVEGWAPRRESLTDYFGKTGKAKCSCICFPTFTAVGPHFHNSTEFVLQVFFRLPRQSWSLTRCILTMVVLPQKLIVTQMFKKFIVFYGIRRFITVFTRARQWALSWATIQLL